MTEEEYFRKNYPDSCYGERPLSPYWDFFQDGVEFGERQSEKKIEELKSELTKKADTNHSLVEQMADLESENAELKGSLELWESGACRVTNLDKCGVVQDLKEQIEKMKCCANCKSFKGYGETCEGWGELVLNLNCDCTEWELKEIEK